MYTGLGYPPFTLLPFLPFTFLPYKTAQIIWVTLSFILFLVSIYLSLKLFGKKVSGVTFSLAFSFAFLAFPTKFTFGMGQVNFAALSLLLAAIYFFQNKKTAISGIAWGVLFIVKPHFLLLLPLLLLVGAWESAGISILVLGLSVAVTGFLFGWSQYVYYFHVTAPALLVFSGRGIYYNQSLGSFFARMLPLSLAADLTFWFSLLIVICGLWFIWRRGIKLAESIMVFIPVFLLVEPLSWQHHYVFLLPVFVWLVLKIRKNRLLLALTAVSFLLIALNFAHPPVVLLSHVFLGNVLLLSLVTHESA